MIRNIHSINKKIIKFLILFSSVVLVLFSLIHFKTSKENSMFFNSQENNISIEKSDNQAKSDISEGYEFLTELNLIFSNPLTHYEGDFIDYDSENGKGYYNLKQDVDFSTDITNEKNIYSSDYDAQFVINSIFNGNNYEIKNYYDSENLIKVTDYSSMFLFNSIESISFYNLNFNNSPFIFNLIGETTVLHNVNFYNINISDLEISPNMYTAVSSPVDMEDGSSKSLTSFGIFANSIKPEFIWENSYIDNIAISNNDFFLNDNSLLSISLINNLTYSDKNASVSYFNNLEISNFQIENNTINYPSNSAINLNSFLFLTPLVTVQGKSIPNFNFYEVDSWENNSNSYSSQKINSTSNSIEKDGNEQISIYSNIFFHDFSINDNYLVSGNDTLDLKIDFNLFFIFSGDDYNKTKFENIILDNFVINNEIDYTFFMNIESNTMFHNINLFVWDNIATDLEKQLLNSSLWIKTNSWSQTSSEKLKYFDQEYWVTEDGQNLALRKSPSIEFDNQIHYDSDNNMYLALKINNFNYTNYDNDSITINIEILDGTNTSNQKIVTQNEQFNLSLSKFDKNILNDKIVVSFSKYNQNLQYTFDLSQVNKNGAVFVDNFSNTYENNTLTISFDLIDNYAYIQNWKIDLYSKSKKLGTINSDVIQKHNLIKINNSSEIPVEQLNTQDSYFVFELTDINGKKYYIEDESTQIGFSSNMYVLQFLKSPLKWISFYWWIILLIIILIISLIMILLFSLKSKKETKVVDNLETRIALIEEKYGIKEYSNEEDEYYYEDDQYYEEDEYYYEDDQYYENEVYEDEVYEK